MKIISNISVIIFFIIFDISGLSISADISGYVTNGTENLPRARVRVQATSNMVYTDYYGKFVLSEITTTDTLVITAWAEGYYNGQTHAIAGDTNTIIHLHPLPFEDNPDYNWISPQADTSEALRCGNCHTDVVMTQWENNAHGQSAKNPFFHAMYYGEDIDGSANVGVGYKRDFEHTQGNCATCHIPGAAANNPWGVDPRSISEVNRNGVFCDVCHKIFNVLPSTGQGTTGVLSIEFLRPPEGEQMFFGPFDDIHEPDAYLPVIRRSEFCAPCHTGKFWGIPAYNCFPEWQASPYPSMGIECQTCHMFPDSVITHFARPKVGGLERDPLTIPSHLQSGSRDQKILENSVTMNMSAEQIDNSIKVTVMIYNDKTGHHVPTGRPSRNMLLLITPTTSTGDTLSFLKGETIPRWGGKGSYKDGNFAGYSGRGFAKILEDFQGVSPAPAWRPTRILSDNRIEAFATDTSHYYFEVPGTDQNIYINARLIFRRFFKPWMDEKKFDIPDIEMENQSIELMTTGIVTDDPSTHISKSYWLDQNYPNPFNQSTMIQFSLAEPEFVSLTLFDVNGRQILTILKKHLDEGRHQVQLDAHNLSSGVFFYKIETESWSAIRKNLLLK